MQYLKNVLTIDPGDHTGYAYWTGTLRPIVGQYNLSHTKDINIQEDELVDLWKKFSFLLKKFNPNIVYIEGVEYWEGSVKSKMAAKRQNLFKLSYIVGGYANEALALGMSVRILPAREWKGQMTDEILEKKLFRMNEQVYPSDHILNAVGIGFSRMGLLQNTRTMPGSNKKTKIKDQGWR